MARSRFALPLAAALACTPASDSGVAVTFPTSAVGAEADLLEAQLDRFASRRPGIRVVRQRTPDAADQRRQLYVQWLNAGATDPDVLQLDVVWTAEFAAAGWILPLQDLATDVADFLPEALRANRWRGDIHALPWFVDVGMLFWRTDLVGAAPRSFEALSREATRAVEDGLVPFGMVWQGAGLDAGAVPREVLSWHEEEVRFAFQNGRALFMRNWPYAIPLLQDAGRSRVAGRFGVAAFPAAHGGRPAAALGGAQLAINARCDQPEAAWRLIEFLTQPEQMAERARVAGQLPARRSLYQGDLLQDALGISGEQLREVIEGAVARPVTPVYTELSERLQVWLHRALSGQAEPAAALSSAAQEMRALLERARLAPDDAGARAGDAP
jgi:multiple sugar transport system substrate-binding protein